MKRIEDAKKLKIKEKADLEQKCKDLYDRLSKEEEKIRLSEVLRLKQAANEIFKSFFSAKEFTVEHSNNKLIAIYENYKVVHWWDDHKFIVNNNGTVIEGEVTLSYDSEFRYKIFVSHASEIDLEIEKLNFDIKKFTEKLKFVLENKILYCYELDDKQYPSFDKLLKAIK